MNRFLLWLDSFLANIEYQQGWRPIERAWDKIMRRTIERAKLSLDIQCAMYGHRYDQWFDGGEICLTCGEKRMRPTVAEKKPTERSQRVDSIMVALQLRPDTIAEARELRRRIEEIAHER